MMEGIKFTDKFGKAHRAQVPSKGNTQSHYSPNACGAKESIKFVDELVKAHCAQIPSPHLILSFVKYFGAEKSIYEANYQGKKRAQGASA